MKSQNQDKISIFRFSTSECLIFSSYLIEIKECGMSFQHLYTVYSLFFSET